MFSFDVVDCLKVYLFEEVLLLRAARDYPPATHRGEEERREAPSGPFGVDPLAHITNTARQAEDESFREEDK
ncbi:unnamed protein product [Sphacelaria rigidula]